MIFWGIAVVVVVVGCGSSNDRPHAAMVDGDYAQQAAKVEPSVPPTRPTEETVTGDAGTVEASAPQEADVANSTVELCEGQPMKLLGSCDVYAGAPRFESGMLCEEHWDANPGATATKLQVKCECGGGVWSPSPCSIEVKNRECSISATLNCTRSVSCLANVSE